MAKSKSNPMGLAKIANRYLEAIGHTEIEPKLHYWNGAWWRWVGTVWACNSESEIQCLVLKWLIEEEITSKSSTAQQITDVIKSFVLNTERRPLPFWCPAAGESVAGPWLNMRNWLVNPEKLAVGDTQGGRRPKSSRWFSVVEVPYDYDSEATCPNWLRWLTQMMPDESSIKLTQEYFGYLLVPETSQHSALFLVGEGGTGKTTVGYVARHMLGDDNTSNLSLPQFASEYGMVTTFGKYLNVVDETSLRISPKEEMALKWYISGTPFESNRKYLGYLSIRPTARLIVATNSFPRFNDPTDGIWRRIMGIRMNNTNHTKDPRILAGLVAERTGIFNWALQGLRRLREQGRFTVSESSPVASYKDAYHPTRGFIDDYLTEVEGGFASNAILGGWYKSWCIANGTKPNVELPQLQEAIIARFPSVSHSRRSVEGRQQRGLINIGLRGPTNETGQ